MMRVGYFSEPAPGHVNEDYVVAGPSWAAVFDGATPQEGFPIGCVHGVAWVVHHLAGSLASSLTLSELPLSELLARAISATRAQHVDSCDLGNPASPSSTVTVVRQCGELLDYLVLADSPLVLDTVDGLRVVVDDRNAHLPSYEPETVEACRNQPGGYWVASTNPDAAFEALTGTVEVGRLRSAALLTDGASRWVDRFHLGGWQDLMGVLAGVDGPRAVVEEVRQAEVAETDEEVRARGKRHDDATALVAVPTSARREIADRAADKVSVPQ